jgi:VanZ family protein
MKLSNYSKAIIIVVCLILSIVGFLVKLPSYFRHIDKELHSLFYFLAAAFLNILFSTKRIANHFAIFISLLLFGIAIEFAQEYSNKLFHTRIHGRFDIEDVAANFKGLLIFSGIWVLYRIFLYMTNKSSNSIIKK